MSDKLHNVLILLSTLLLLCCESGCVQTNKASAQPETPNLKASVGKNVVLEGPLEIAGKFGPYILAGKEPIYLQARDERDLGELNSLTEKLSGIQGKSVSFSGILRFQKALPSSNPMVSSVPAYYFMEYPGAKVTTKP